MAAQKITCPKCRKVYISSSERCVFCGAKNPMFGRINKTIRKEDDTLKKSAGEKTVKKIHDQTNEDLIEEFKLSTDDIDDEEDTTPPSSFDFDYEDNPDDGDDEDDDAGMDDDDDDDQDNDQDADEEDDAEEDDDSDDDDDDMNEDEDDEEDENDEDEDDEDEDDEDEDEYDDDEYDDEDDEDEDNEEIEDGSLTGNTQRSPIRWKDKEKTVVRDPAEGYDENGRFNPDFDSYYADTKTLIENEIDSRLAGKEKFILKIIAGVVTIAGIIVYLVLTL